MEKRDEIRIPWGTGIVGFVAESGEPVNIPDAYKVSRLSVCLLTNDSYLSRFDLEKYLFNGYKLQ